MTAKVDIDVYTVTASRLQQLLQSGVYKSVDLVSLYLRQIEHHNHNGYKLHAVNVTDPRVKVIEEALMLDYERAQGKIRSPVHGIPIIIKDNTITGSLGMPTTSGSLGLVGLVNDHDAAYVKLLREAGCIIIAKSNLSELGNMKGTDIMSGWSPFGGQTQSPYVRGGVDNNDCWLGHSAPGGSSSGSAVSVAAGFVPWSIGTETDGSVVWPAIRAALYSLKITVGAMDMFGTQGDGNTFFTAGGMAKSAADVALLTSILLSKPSLNDIGIPSWRGLRLASVDPRAWRWPSDFCVPKEEYFVQTESALESAMRRIEQLGATVVRNAPLQTPESFFADHGWKNARFLAVHQVRPCLERYLKLFHPHRLQTLEDIVRFNQEHAAEEMPPENGNQDYLIDAMNDTMTAEQFKRDMETYRTDMRQAVERCLEDTGADVIIAPGDTNLTTVGMGTGYPIASAPLGFADFNGRPFGLLFLARENQEQLLLKVLAAWESSFPQGRKPPPLMTGTTL